MTIAAVIFVILASAVLPIGLAVFACTRRRGYWKALLAGLGCFTFFQLLLRLPLLQYVLPNFAWFSVVSATQPILYIFLLSLSAGVFEELGRYIVMRIFLKKHLSAGDGISFGIGHGGIEAVSLVGINYILAFALYGTAAFSTASDGLIFSAGCERIFALAIQIALSVMVMLSIKRKKPLWLLLALVLHTAVDFFSVLATQFFSAFDFSPLLVELGLFFVALLSLWFIFFEYKKEKLQATSDASPKP